VLAPALHGRRVHPESPRDLVHSRLAGHEREHGLLPLFHRATTGACSHVRVDGTGDLCLHGDLCDSLRSLLVLPSGTFHCRCSLTRSQGNFQFLEVSTSRWGTRYPVRWRCLCAMDCVFGTPRHAASSHKPRPPESRSSAKPRLTSTCG